MNLEIFAPEVTAEVVPGTDLAKLMIDSMLAYGGTLRDQDVAVFAQKVVSKSEGRMVELASVQPGARAVAIAQSNERDPRLIELMLAESAEVIRCTKNVVIVRNRYGVVLANAGIDQSNISHEMGERALLLPVDPDASARRLHQMISKYCGATVGVVINDSLGRAWRNGTVGTALGVYGLPGLQDLRGVSDRHGRTLTSTQVGFADEVAATGSLVMGQAAESRPFVLIRGLQFSSRPSSAAELIRAANLDLFP